MPNQKWLNKFKVISLMEGISLDRTAIMLYCFRGCKTCAYSTEEKIGCLISLLEKISQGYFIDVKLGKTVDSPEGNNPDTACVGFLDPLNRSIGRKLNV